MSLITSVTVQYGMRKNQLKEAWEQTLHALEEYLKAEQDEVAVQA